MNDIYHPKDGCELKSVVLGRDASRKKKESSALDCSPSDGKTEYPKNVVAFIGKWQPVEEPRRKAFWKEFRKAANAYSSFREKPIG